MSRSPQIKWEEKGIIELQKTEALFLDHYAFLYYGIISWQFTKFLLLQKKKKKLWLLLMQCKYILYVNIHYHWKFGISKIFF